LDLSQSISASSFWVPEHLSPQSAWLEHAPFAFWLVDALRPGTIVELGTHWGFSYFAFCQAVAQLRLPARCFAVDTWKGDEHAGFYAEDVFEHVRDHNLKHYASFSELMRSTFDGALARFENESIDLLHIDGRHYYEDVRHDFESWKGKLSERSVVVFHDTNVHERNFGVFKLWAELAQQYPHFEFFHGYGLGVLGFGKDLPDAMRRLMAQDDTAANATRVAYARLGQAVAMQVEVGQREKGRSKDKNVAADVLRLQKLIAHHDAVNSKLATELVQSKADVANLRMTLARRDKELAAIEKRLEAQAAAARLLMKSTASTQKVAIVIHAYYPDILREILKPVRALPKHHKLFVTTVAKHEAEVRTLLKKENLPFSLHVFENRGRDVLPFIKVYPQLRAEGFDLLVKVHTKKSPHRRDGKRWRKDVLGKLLEKAAFEHSLEAFATDPSLGMVGPAGHYVSMSSYMGGNEAAVLSVGKRLGLDAPEIRALGFFAGTMFMARAEALDPILRLRLDEANFDVEAGQLDGTFAHALERAMALSVVASNMRIASTADTDLWPVEEDHYEFVTKRKLRHAVRDSLRRVRRKVKPRVRFITRLAAGDTRERARLWSKFDAKFYREHYPDVAASGIDLFEHYVTYGRNEGRLGAPSPIRAGRDYQAWIARHDLNPGHLHRLVREIVALPAPPRFSVVMPVYNAPEQFLRAAIDSVRNQIYPHWELCIADDGSTLPHVRSVLEDCAASDPRIKLVFRKVNGHISQATNSAFALATGDWIALLDHDDILRPHALAEVALEIARHPQAELIYSDEDKLDRAGERCDPYFKPDFSRELFRSQNYLNHLTVHRAANIRAVGGWRPGFEGSLDYELYLRFIERIDSSNICHISKILYHWRATEGSTAAAGSEKKYAYDAGLRALEEHIARTKLPAKVEEAPGAPYYRIRLSVPEPQPLVSLIIPMRDKVELSRLAVDSIFQKTTYANYEIIVVDNGSNEPQTHAYFAEIAKQPNVRILRYDEPFNYSAINNFAVKQAKGSIIGLINNDIEIISPGWLNEMVSWATQDDVGCVGAKLYYPDDTIQHAGVILGIGGVAGHSHKRLRRDELGYFGRANLLQNLSAVTAACLLVRKAVYDEVGGLNEKDLAVAFNDVDFCLRVRESGYLNVWTPYAEAYHHESASRGPDSRDGMRERFEREVGYMLRKWSTALVDPYYSPNLTRTREDFSFLDR
jgi:GT2 family glycosyltransferase